MADREWTSVKERLPEPLDDVLCWFSGNQKSMISWLDHTGHFLYEDGFGKVTHWAPLPPPPGEEDAK